MSELLCITNAGWSGVIEALKTTTKVLGKGSVITVNGSIPSYSNAAQMIMNDVPQILLLGGYDGFFHSAINRLRGRSKIIVVWCSNILQSELTNEIDQLNKMIDMLKNSIIDGIAFVEDGSYKSMKRTFPNLNFLYFPTVPVPRTKPFKIELDPSKFHVDIFCTPDGRKNIYNQLLAYANLAQVHVNYDKSTYVNIISKFDNVKNYGRMPIELLDQYSASVDLCSQISANESFNYVAADHMFLGVPVIASKFVPAVAETKSQLIHKYLIVQDFTSVEEIYSKVKYIKDNPSLKQELNKIVKDEINIIAHERAEILKYNYKMATK